MRFETDAYAHAYAERTNGIDPSILLLGNCMRIETDADTDADADTRLRANGNTALYNFVNLNEIGIYGNIPQYSILCRSCQLSSPRLRHVC